MSASSSPGLSQSYLNAKGFILRHHRRFVIAICLLSLCLFLIHIIRYTPRLTSGFAAYYGFSKMLLDNERLSDAYDYGAFNKRLTHYGFTGIWDVEYNLPTNAIVFVPFSLLSPSAAKIAWTFFSLALYLVSIRILLSVLGIEWGSNDGLSIIALAGLWRPSYQGIAHGQMYFLILVLFMLTLWGVHRNKPATSSIALASSFLAKGYGVVTAAWFLFNQRSKTLLIIFIVVLLGFLLTLPIVRLETWVSYWTEVASGFGSMPKSGRVAYQTLTSFFLRLFLYDPEWLPVPVLRLPSTFVKWTNMMIFSAFVIALLRASSLKRETPLLVSFSISLAVNVITAPIAEEHHFVLTLPLAISFLFVSMAGHDGRARLGGWEMTGTISVIVLAIPIGYKSLEGTNFPQWLLAYPKLYASILLIFSSVVVNRRNRQNSLAHVHIRSKEKAVHL